MSKREFAIKVIWTEGNEEFVKAGVGSQVACFRTRKDAQNQKDFMLIGMADEVQSINVVPFPRLKPGKGRK